MQFSMVRIRRHPTVKHALRSTQCRRTDAVSRRRSMHLHACRQTLCFLRVHRRYSLLCLEEGGNAIATWVFAPPCLICHGQSFTKSELSRGRRFRSHRLRHRLRLRSECAPEQAHATVVRSKDPSLTHGKCRVSAEEIDFAFVGSCCIAKSIIIIHTCSTHTNTAGYSRFCCNNTVKYMLFWHGQSQVLPAALELPASDIGNPPQPLLRNSERLPSFISDKRMNATALRLFFAISLLKTCFRSSDAAPR